MLRGHHNPSGGNGMAFYPHPMLRPGGNGVKLVVKADSCRDEGNVDLF